MQAKQRWLLMKQLVPKQCNKSLAECVEALALGQDLVRRWGRPGWECVCVESRGYCVVNACVGGEGGGRAGGTAVSVAPLDRARVCGFRCSPPRAHALPTGRDRRRRTA
jgi:hypothetical protein